MSNSRRRVNKQPSSSDSEEGENTADDPRETLILTRLHCDRLYLWSFSTGKHSCPICGRKYLQAYSVDRHVKLVHEGRTVPAKRESSAFLTLNINTYLESVQYGGPFFPFLVHECKSCGKSFEGETAYIKHLQSDHRDIQKNVLSKYK